MKSKILALLLATPFLTMAQGSRVVPNVGAISVVPINDVTTANINTAGGITVSTNTLLVRVDGNNTTGARGTGLAFANLYYAAGQSQYGDIIYVYDGIYNEGTNVVPHIPGRHIIGIGNPILQFFGTNTSINSNSIYIKTADNLYVENLTFEPKTTNWFSAGFGSTTNSPSATNWVLRNFRGINLDSDGCYFNSTNFSSGSIYNINLKGFWDCFATGPVLNTNTVIYIEDFEFDCNFDNGTVPGSIRPILIQGDGANISFNRGIVRANKSGSVKVGINANGILKLNQIVFDITGNTNVLLNSVRQIFVNNCITIDGNYLNIANEEFRKIGTAPLLGAITIPMDKSYNTNVNGYAYGQWDFIDRNVTNAYGAGALVITNKDNPASSLPFSMMLASGIDEDSTVPALEINGRFLSTLGMPTNSAAFGLNKTNDYVLGTRYTNTVAGGWTGGRAWVGASFSLTAAAAGTATVTLFVEGTSRTNRTTISAGPLASLVVTEWVGDIVGPNEIWYFADEDSGAGSASAIVTLTSKYKGL